MAYQRGNGDHETNNPQMGDRAVGGGAACGNSRAVRHRWTAFGLRSDRYHRANRLVHSYHQQPRRWRLRDRRQHRGNGATFSEDVTVTGGPQLRLAIGGPTKTAAYGSTSGSNVVFSYTVAERDSDTDGIAIAANKLTLNGGTIKDAAENDADLSHEALPARPAIKWTESAQGCLSLSF